MKRGSSHMEMIISFILFFSFLFFLFIYLQPVSDTSLSKSVLGGLRDSFKQEASTELTSFFIKTNKSKGGFSIFLDNKISNVNFSNCGVLVKDLNGRIKDAGLNEKGRRFILSVNDSGGSYYVYISPIFNNSFSSGKGVSYSMGDVRDRRLLAMAKMQDLAARYEEDYGGLKEGLRVPANFDFAIKGPVEMEGNVPENVEVFAREYVEDVLYDNGDVKSVGVIFKIW